MAILRNAHFDGQTTGYVNTGNEPGIDGIVNTNPLYTTAYVLHGQAAMLSENGGVASTVRQNLPSPAGSAHWRAYVNRVGTNASNAAFAVARDSSGNTTCATLAVGSSGGILLRDGFSTVATSSYLWTVGSWVRLEWFVDRANSTQSLDIYHGANLEGMTPSESLSGACTAGTSPLGNFLAGLNAAVTSAQFAVDELAIGDAPIGPFVPSTITVSVWDGATEVAASIDSVAT